MYVYAVKTYKEYVFVITVNCRVEQIEYCLQVMNLSLKLWIIVICVSKLLNTCACIDPDIFLFITSRQYGCPSSFLGLNEKHVANFLLAG